MNQEQAEIFRDTRREYLNIVQSTSLITNVEYMREFVRRHRGTDRPTGFAKELRSSPPPSPRRLLQPAPAGFRDETNHGFGGSRNVEMEDTGGRRTGDIAMDDAEMGTGGRRTDGDGMDDAPEQRQKRTRPYQPKLSDDEDNEDEQDLPSPKPVYSAEKRRRISTYLSGYQTPVSSSRPANAPSFRITEELWRPSRGSTNYQTPAPTQERAPSFGGADEQRLSRDGTAYQTPAPTQTPGANRPRGRPKKAATVPTPTPGASTPASTPAASQNGSMSDRLDYNITYLDGPKLRIELHLDKSGDDDDDYQELDVVESDG
jgi:hypothetical protein